MHISMDDNNARLKLILLLCLTATLFSCNSIEDENGVNLKTKTPTNLNAQSADKSITLSWDNSEDASSHNIYMASEQNVSFDGKKPDGVTDLANFMIHSAVPNPYVHSSLENNKAYYFVVTSVAADGTESALSIEVSTTPLAKPNNVQAIATKDSVTLSWNNENNVSSYNIYMASEPNINLADIQNDAVSPLADFMRHLSVPNPFVHPKLDSSKTYYFVIVALANDGTKSILSDEVSAIPLSINFAATNLSLGFATSSKVPLRWQDGSDIEQGFRIQRAELFADGTSGDWTPAGEVAANISQFDDTTMTPGLRYQYRVLAYEGVNNSDFSNIITANVPPRDSNRFLQFSNRTAPRNIETEQTALAYYDIIDPTGVKKTFSDWKNLNGFGSNVDADTPAIYQNDADLGFGRRMYVIEQTNGNVASYVQNYPTLDDAINNTNLLVTVAMEYTQPIVDQSIAAKKLVAITAGSYLTTDNFTEYSATLQAGNYTFVAARDGSDSLNKGPFSLTVTFSDGITKTLNFTGEWVSEWYYSSDFTDPSNPTFNVDVPAAQVVTIKLSSNLSSKIMVLGSIGRILAEDDNSAGGIMPRITASLPAGKYWLIATSAKPFTKFSSNSWKISSNLTAAVSTNLLYTSFRAASVNDPNSPAYSDNATFIVTPPAGSTTVDIVIESNTLPGADIDPYLYLIGASETGVEVTRKIIDVTSRSSFGKGKIVADLPQGTYTAVAATLFNKLTLTGATGDFSLTVKNALGELISFNPPVPIQKWVTLGGNTPFSPDNPHFSFTVNPSVVGETETVTIELIPTEDPFFLSSTRPVLYLLGDIGDYRHIVATDTEKEQPIPPVREAVIHTTLAAGQYSVVSTTAVSGQTSDFQLDVRINNTSVISTTGNWTNSSGRRIQSIATNPTSEFTVTTDNSDIVIRLRATENTLPMLYLLDSTTKVINQNIDPQYTTSYIDTQLLPGKYALVATTDSTVDRQENFTLNYSIDSIAQTPINGNWNHSQPVNPYSPNNPRYEFTIDKNSHFEASLTSNLTTALYILGFGDERITTFYTFGADGNRVTKVDLDGRGEKFQPGVCSPCHGGNPESLVAGSYPDHGNTRAQHIAWDLDLFKYTDTDPRFSRSAQEAKFKQFNKTVLAMKVMPSEGTGEDREPAQKTVIKGWYGGHQLPSDVFQSDFIPTLWIPDSITGNQNNIPDGADELYTNVVKPTCRVCHLQRGGLLDAKSGKADIALAFGSYKAFMTYAEHIENTIYDKSTMPMALRTFNKFWQEGQGKLLAKHLANFSRFKSANGDVLKPGRPIANAGTNPLTGPLLIPTGIPFTLNGNTSSFADTYQWSSTSGNTTLTGANTATPTFTPSAAGDYSFDLTVSNSNGSSSAQIILTAAAPANVTTISFANDIMARYDPTISAYISTAMGNCMECHARREDKINGEGDFSTYFDEYSHDSSPYSVIFLNNDMYKQVRNRVNLEDPLQSMILDKTSISEHHGDGTASGYSLEPNRDRTHYDTILQWILEGAKNN